MYKCNAFKLYIGDIGPIYYLIFVFPESNRAYNCPARQLYLFVVPNNSKQSLITEF